MPGEQPRRAPPPTMTGDLQPCPAASGLGHPSQPPTEDHPPVSRTTQGMREAGSKAQAREPPEAQPRQAQELEPKALLLRTQALSSLPRKAGSPQAPARKSHPQAHTWGMGRADHSPPQLYSLSITSCTPKPALDETPEGPQCEAPRDPEAEAPSCRVTGAHRRPSLLRAKALPAPKELNSQRCFQEAPPGFTSTDYTSPKATPGPLPLKAPQSNGASPHGPACYPEFQASGANAWPPAAADNFQGADFGVPPTEPEPFPEGSRPGSPQGSSFQYPFSAQAPHGAGTKPFPADPARRDYADKSLVFAFHQPPGPWQDTGMGTGPAYPLPAGPASTTLPCFPSQPGSLDDPRGPGGALSDTGAAHLAPRPFPDRSQKSLTKVLPEGALPAHDSMGSSRGVPNPLPQRHFPGQAYGANRVASSPEPVDTELTTPGPAPTTLSQLWDTTAAPYPTPALGPPDTARMAFLDGQPGPGQGLCLPPSSPVPWPLPGPGPSPHQMEILSQLPFPGGTPEWQSNDQGAVGATCKGQRPGEPLAILRGSPAQPGSSPGMFPYCTLKDAGAQPLFFGGTQPQASPRGAPGLPPPRVVGASPSESPLPSPATNAAGSSTCSSLSPLSSSPANPSSEDSLLPGPLGPPAFFHPPHHPQESGSSFPSPEPPTLPTSYQPEPAQAFPFPTDGLGAEDPGAGRAVLQGFPRDLPPYTSHHFSLSSASLDQLDVLLTCRQCDHNYGSLAAFLAHRPFCKPARVGDGCQQPPGPPAPTTTPKAPTHMHTGPLSHSQTVSFLLARDVQADGKDDPLRTSFLSGLATPFPLPASDLDMEDEAKLDSLITEALNGMEYQSDNPEIDSSFIDVFTDEEPSGPRGPGAGQPTNNQPGATPEHSAQLLLPARADTPKPRDPCPGDGNCSSGNRPKTRSLGLVPMEADATSLVKPQRRGKQFKLLCKELDTATGPKGPCLRPRRRGCSAEQPLPRPRNLRTQARGCTDPDGQAPRINSSATETRSSRRLRLPCRKDARKRRAPGGTWSKELIHQIVQQKNRRQGRHRSRLTRRALPSAQVQLGECGCTSESEEEEQPWHQGPGSRGRSRRGHRRWHQGERKNEEDVTHSPRKGLREDAGEHGNSPTLGGPCHPSGSQGAREASVERGPKHTDGPVASPDHPPQFPTNTKTPEENHPSLDFSQEGPAPAVAEESVPSTTQLRQGSSSSPAICVKGSPQPPAPEPTQPGENDPNRSRPPGSQAHMLPSQSPPAPGGNSLLCAPGAHHREDCPAHQPGGFLTPAANAAEATCPETHILLLKNAGVGCGPYSNRDHVGALSAGKEPHPNSRMPSESFLGPRNLEGHLPEDLCPEPSAVRALATNSPHVSPDGVDTLEPKPPQQPPHSAERDPENAPSPLTLESMSLFAGLPEDGFDPPLCHSQSAHRDSHMPLASADSLPQKPVTEPLYPSFPLVAEVSPVLPSQFPDLLGGKAFSKKCPHEGLVPPSLPPVPGKGSECGLTFMSNLSEDELEIKRLVTELESQLQRKEGTRGKAACADSLCPNQGTEPAFVPPPLQAASPPGDTLSAESDLYQEGVGAATATREGVLGSPKQQWPFPTRCCPGEAAPPPSTHQDPGSGTPLSPAGHSTSLQAEQKARVFKTEGDSGDPIRLRALLLEGKPLAECHPNCERLLPKNSETVRMQGTEDTPLWHLCEQSIGHSPEPPEAGASSRGSSALGAFGNPRVHLAPDLVIPADGDAPLDATPPPGACHSGATKGHSVPSALAGTSPLTAPLGGEAQYLPMPGPARVPDASPGRRPQDPASFSSHQPQVLGARAESKEGLRGLQGVSQHWPSGLERDNMESGSTGCMQVTAVPAVAGHQLGPMTERHLGSPGQAENPKGCGKASQLQSVNQRTTGAPDGLAKVNDHPENPLTRPAEGPSLVEGSEAASGLWKQGQTPPGPASSGGAASSPMVSHTPKGPEDIAPGKTSSPGFEPQLLFNGESPAPHPRDLGTHVPSPTTTPTLCSLQPLPQKDSPLEPSGALEAGGKAQGLLPASASCTNPPSAQCLPSHPVGGQHGGASYVQAPTDAGAGGSLAALPSSATSPCGPKEILSGCPPLTASSPKDSSCCQSGLSTASAPAHMGHSPEDSTLKTLEDSKREDLRSLPACDKLPPPGGAFSPRMTSKPAGPSSIPAEDGPEVVRGLQVPDSHHRGATLTSPFSVSQGPSGPPSSTTLPGHGEGKGTRTGPKDPTSPGTTRPDPYACLEGETGAGRGGQGHQATPGARRTAVKKVPRAGTRGPATTQPHDLKSDSPQSETSVPHQTPQKDPKHSPRGFKKKPEPTEKGHGKSQAPAKLGPPVTCEICSASFRSRPGLNRHKARKHRPHRATTSPPSPTATLAYQALQPTAQICQAPRKKSYKRPACNKASHLLMDPGHASRPPPDQGSTVPKDALGPGTLRETRRSPGAPGTPDSSLNQQPYPAGQKEQEEGVRASASKLRSDPLEVDKLHPRQTEDREGQRQSEGSPGSSEGNSKKTVGRRRARRSREKSTPPVSADVALARHRCNHVSCCLSLEREHEAGLHSATPGPGLEDMADTGPGFLHAEQMAPMSPRDQRLRQGRSEGVSPEELPVGQRGALVRRSRGPRESRAPSICKEPPEDSRGAKGRPGKGAGDRSPSPLEASNSAGGSAITSGLRGLPEARAGVQGPEAHSRGPGDPPNSLDDEASFSQLFPVGGRFTRKKTPRVYRKRGKGPRRQPPPQPSIEPSGLLCAARMPTDLSDSGSLCLSLQDPWEDEASGLPESFLLDELLGSKAPSLDPWVPSFSLWGPELNREASSGEEVPSCCAEDAEAIPKLHMVPAAWRGLGLQAPTNETSSSLGDGSPEPPDLEREHYDGGLPGTSSLLPLHTKDLEMLSAELETQDLCFLGSCEDFTGLLHSSLLDFKASAKLQGPGSERTEEAARAGQAQGRELTAQGRRASYKCRVCFQRFHSLGELDLHKLAHSPAPPPTCYMCVERRFSSRELLREHLREKHEQGKEGPWACGMCLKEVADVWMYNQHLREHAARFARKGQARKPLGGLSEGLEPESSISPFLDGMVERTPYSSRHTASRASRGPREAGKETPGEQTKPRAQARSRSPDRTKSRSSATHSAKMSPSLTPEPRPHSEPLLQATPVRSACRDPSRDCHHCGKRFPKPFKLQRHLAVHSPQRVYLCHWCPGVFPEPQELRGHLERAHEVREERELPHTPLYACELCANVMRVIRRSFVCSSCNYTFAKKEQFDRHMDKHLRGGQQPLVLRGVRRPGTPGQRAPALEGSLPKKRRKVAVPSSPPGPIMARPLSQGSPTLSEGSPPALPQLCPEVAPSTTECWPDPGSHPLMEDKLPSNRQELPPASLSPFPSSSADGRGGQRLDQTLKRPEYEAWPGNAGPHEQQAGLERKRESYLLSGKHRSPGAHGKCSSDGSPGDPSPLQQEKQTPTSHMSPEGNPGSHKGRTTKPSKDRAAASTPRKDPKLSVQQRKPLGTESLAPRELTHSTEGRVKPTCPKAKPRHSFHGSKGPGPATKTGGGSQPQPASGQLQSETATTPGRPTHPGPSPTSDKSLSRAQARGCTKGPRKSCTQGSLECPGPREMGESKEKRRKGHTMELTKCEDLGSSGKAPSAHEKPPRAPRKQATPSRLLPTKPRPSSQSSKMRPQPLEQQKEELSHAHRRETLGRHCPQARPLLRSPERGRAVRSAEVTELRDHRTAESQSNLLSQLFGQRLTSFKIPLKKGTST